ncbi:histidinol-phosphatase HisJ family protein [Anaerovorax odorimutans]|uniref:histidinol-phosphatase HisJ family protein n=1 Tax=Anaerovorax odorimutans TaxID=109327 RepID=UPI0004214D81|nr:histidinol-phosphatase HisJ family protein [Anaerovorax odorimutans]
MYDYHTHTNFSDDGDVEMKDMVQTAYNKGIFEIAITDHYDPDYPDKAFPFLLNFEEYHKTLENIRKQFKDKIKVIKGIEIGIQHGTTMKKISEAVNSYNYDFVLGSFHCAEGFELYGENFFKGRSVEESYEAFYRYMFDCLDQYKDYDVLSHFNIIDRYSSYVAKPSLYMDIVESILKKIIYDGKGIEINTSSFRYGMGERTTPAQEILQLYKDLGGEIITTGSDAHEMSYIGHMLDYAQHMIKSVGLKYITTFENRKPTFIKLPD